MKTHIPFGIIVLLIIGMCCNSNEPTEPEIDDAVTVQNESSNVFVTVRSGSVYEEDDVNVLSTFTEKSVLISIESSIPLSGPARISIHYENELDYDAGNGESIEIVHFDEYGDPDTSIELTIDAANKIISFEADHFSIFYLRVGTSSFLGNVLSKCQDIDELRKYIVAKFIQEVVENIENEDNAELKCWKINELYLWCKRLAPIWDSNYALGSHLLDMWLTGEGKASEPVVIDNERFDDSQDSQRTWEDVWREAARARAEKLHSCALVGDEDSWIIGEEKVIGHRSSTVGVGDYDFYVSGQVTVECNAANEAAFIFDMTVQAKDVVDFNYSTEEGSQRNGAFPFFIGTLCGEDIKAVIPDKFGVYLRDNCSNGENYKDYCIQGTETVFSFDASDFPDLPCAECEQTGTERDVFRRTSASFPHDLGDFDCECRNEFGEGFRMADFSEVAAFVGEYGFDAFFEQCGMTSYRSNGWVTNGGSHFWSTNRHYFIERHDGSVPAGWLVHSSLGSHTIDLGSWWNSRPILCVGKSNGDQ